MAKKQYTYQTRFLAATPRNKRLTDGIQAAAETGGSGINYIPNSSPQYWQLITADAEGNPLDESDYYLTPVSGRHLVMSGDVVAYGVDSDIEDIPFPVASYTTKGILSVKQGGALIIDNGVLSLDDDLVGGLNEEKLEQYLTTNKYVNENWLSQNGYLTLKSQLSGYAKAEKYAPLAPTDTLLSALGKLEANFANFVDLTSNQTISGNKTFNNLIVGKQDIVCYGVDGSIDDVPFPVASYTTKGILSVKQGGALVIEDGVLSLDRSAGGVNFTVGTGLNLSVNDVLSVKFGTTSGTACQGNDSRLSDDRPCPYSLSWNGYSSGSYDGSSSRSISIPNNTNQLTNGAGFIRDGNGTFTTLSGSGSSSKYLAGNGMFYQIAYSELSGTPNLNLYVKKAGDTMTGNLTIDKSSPALILSGSRTWQLQESGGDLRFVNNGSLGAYFSGVNNGNMVLYGDFTARGDVVAYSANSSISDIEAIASTSTYGLIKYDGRTIGKNSSGQLYVIDSGSGGGGTSVSWGTSGSEYAELTVESTTKRLSVNGHTHTWSQIGSKPSWIGSSKPSYSWSEITGKPSIISSINVSRSGSGNVVTSLSVSGSTIYYNMGNVSGGSSWNGGTVSNNITITSGGMNIKGGSGGYLGLYYGSNYWQIQITSGNDLYFMYRGSRAGYFSGSNVGNFACTRVVETSDMRKKVLVNTLDGVLDKIVNIPIYRYYLKSDPRCRIEIGSVSQEVEPLFAELSYTEHGDYYLDYGKGFSSLAIQGIKELYARFRPVENKVAVLESRIKNLQSRLDNAYREIFALKAAG